MKSLVLCVCVLIIGSSSSTELKEQIRSAIGNNEDDVNTCQTENNVTREDYYDEEDIMTNVHNESENEERTQKVGCYMACLLKKRNLMEGSNLKEGQILVKFVERNAHDPQRLKILRKCLKEARSITQACEKCFSIYVCAVRAEHKAHEEHEKKDVETTGSVTEGEMTTLEVETEQE